MRWFKNITNWFEKKSPVLPRVPPMGMKAADPAMAQKILGMLEKTQAEELSCDDVYALLDQFTEMAARGEDVASLMPMVKQHLDMCTDCREEYEALLNVINNSG